MTNTPDQYIFPLFKNMFRTAILLITTTTTPVQYLCPLFKNMYPTAMGSAQSIKDNSHNE